MGVCCSQPQGLERVPAQPIKNTLLESKANREAEIDKAVHASFITERKRHRLTAKQEEEFCNIIRKITE